MILEILSAILLMLAVLGVLSGLHQGYRRRVRVRCNQPLSVWPIDGRVERQPPRAAGLRSDRRSVAQYHLSGWGGRQS